MSETHENSPQEVPSNGATRPALLPLVIWFALLPVAGAYGGWLGHDFVGWQNFALALGVGVAGTMMSVAISWLQNPVLHEDGSYVLRSLLAVVVAYGVVGGLFVGLILWLVAAVLGGIGARLPSSWN